MKTLIKAKIVSDVVITDNILPESIESFIDADSVEKANIARNRVGNAGLDEAMEEIKSTIYRSVLDELEKNRIYAKVGQLKQEKSSATKIERYKELLEMINLHKEVLTPVYPHLQEWTGHAFSALKSILY